MLPKWRMQVSNFHSLPLSQVLMLVSQVAWTHPIPELVQLPNLQPRSHWHSLHQHCHTICKSLSLLSNFCPLLTLPWIQTRKCRVSLYYPSTNTPSSASDTSSSGPFWQSLFPYTDIFTTIAGRSATLQPLFREVAERVTDLRGGQPVLPWMHPRPALDGARLVAQTPAGSSPCCRNGEGG